jgi:hypothetical protein
LQRTGQAARGIGGAMLRQTLPAAVMRQILSGRSREALPPSYQFEDQRIRLPAGQPTMTFGDVPIR